MIWPHSLFKQNWSAKFQYHLSIVYNCVTCYCKHCMVIASKSEWKQQLWFYCSAESNPFVHQQKYFHNTWNILPGSDLWMRLFFVITVNWLSMSHWKTVYIFFPIEKILCRWINNQNKVSHGLFPSRPDVHEKKNKCFCWSQSTGQ